MLISESELLMASVVKTEAQESEYDLEYRSGEDDAWYSVFVVFDAGAETLTVKYNCAPVLHVAVFSAGDFRTEAQVEELIGRFRPVSQQLQDHDCLKLSIGTTICGAHGINNNDLRFYDAIVEAVEHRPHLFSGGEEECLCTFLLFWKHGRGCDTLTSVNIDSICLIESADQIDPRISAFAKMAKKKIASFDTPSNGSSPNRPVEPKTSKRFESLTVRTEDVAPISNPNQWRNQDEDMGPTSCITEHFFIVINNLEKDLTASEIKNFIFEKTTILPEAYVFPCLFTDPFARGVMMVDSQNKAQTIQEYLETPNHLVVSSRGRPWVITTKASTGLLASSIWNFIPVCQDEIKPKRTRKELEVVVSGTESYERAKQLRDLVLEFLRHEADICKKLVLEEKRLLCHINRP